MDDLEKKIKEVEDLPNKQIKVKGFKFSGASIMALFALISTILGSLYGGSKSRGTCKFRFGGY